MDGSHYKPAFKEHTNNNAPFLNSGLSENSFLNSCSNLFFSIFSFNFLSRRCCFSISNSSSSYIAAERRGATYSSDDDDDDDEEEEEDDDDGGEDAEEGKGSEVEETETDGDALLRKWMRHATEMAATFCQFNSFDALETLKFKKRSDDTMKRNIWEVHRKKLLLRRWEVWQKKNVKM